MKPDYPSGRDLDLTLTLEVAVAVTAAPTLVRVPHALDGRPETVATLV